MMICLSSGVMGKSHSTHSGSGVNYLCLPLDPEDPDNVQGGAQTGASVYGVEYRKWHSDRFFVDVDVHDAPCAVCEAQGRSQLLMIPAKRTCPAGWTFAYEGVLASQHNAHASGGDFICVSTDPEATHGSQENQSGGILHVVEAVCGSLPCPPYENGNELSCVVCTK